MQKPTSGRVSKLNPGFGEKPSLVQRTSSADHRKDVTKHILRSLYGLLQLREFFVTVDHFSIWRRHLSWAKEDGAQLRTYIVQKYSTNMVFMSLLLGAELNVLFNSSHVTTQMRQDMQEQSFHKMEFWTGLTITMSVLFTLFTLLSTFTAWGMVSVVSDENAHCVLRSSIGQYVAFLPSRLIVAAIYSFLLWMVMFIIILLPHIWSVVLLCVVFSLFFHIVASFSAFGRLVMHTGAMGSSRIFAEEFEQKLLPRGLHTSLLLKAAEELKKGTSVTRQYKQPTQPIGHSEPKKHDDEKAKRSSVRFADTKWERAGDCEGTNVFKTGPFMEWQRSGVLEGPSSVLICSPVGQNEKETVTAPALYQSRNKLSSIEEVGSKEKDAPPISRPGRLQRTQVLNNNEDLKPATRNDDVPPTSIRRPSILRQSTPRNAEQDKIEEKKERWWDDKEAHAGWMPDPDILNRCSHTPASLLRVVSTLSDDSSRDGNDEIESSASSATKSWGNAFMDAIKVSSPQGTRKKKKKEECPSSSFIRVSDDEESMPDSRAGKMKEMDESAVGNIARWGDPPYDASFGRRDPESGELSAPASENCEGGSAPRREQSAATSKTAFLSPPRATKRDGHHFRVDTADITQTVLSSIYGDDPGFGRGIGENENDPLLAGSSMNMCTKKYSG